jgi:hypothetical protein
MWPSSLYELDRSSKIQLCSIAQKGEHIDSSGPERLVLNGSRDINRLGAGENEGLLEDDD